MIKLVLFIYETLQFSNDSSTRCSLFACIRTFRVHACIFISGLYRGNRIWPFHGIVGFLMLVFSFSLCGFVLNNGRLDVDDVCVCVMFRLMFGLYTNGSRGRLRLPLLMCSISFLHLSLSLLVVVSCSLHVSCQRNIYWHSLLCHLVSLKLLC